MLKLKPFIYSQSVPLQLAGSPIAVKSSGAVPVNSRKQSLHQSLPLVPTRLRLIHLSFSVSMESPGVNTASPSPSVVKLKPIEATPETFKEFGQVIAFDFLVSSCLLCLCYCTILLLLFISTCICLTQVKVLEKQSLYLFVLIFALFCCYYFFIFITSFFPFSYLL